MCGESQSPDGDQKGGLWDSDKYKAFHLLPVFDMSFLNIQSHVIN